LPPGLLDSPNNALSRSGRSGFATDHTRGVREFNLTRAGVVPRARNMLLSREIRKSTVEDQLEITDYHAWSGYLSRYSTVMVSFWNI